MLIHAKCVFYFVLLVKLSDLWFLNKDKVELETYSQREDTSSYCTTNYWLDEAYHADLQLSK